MAKTGHSDQPEKDNCFKVLTYLRSSDQPGNGNCFEVLTYFKNNGQPGNDNDFESNEPISLFQL